MTFTIAVRNPDASFYNESAAQMRQDSVVRNLARCHKRAFYSFVVINPTQCVPSDDLVSYRITDFRDDTNLFGHLCF
jgi:hypothetical protein